MITQKLLKRSYKKKIGLLCRAKKFLDEIFLKTIYFSYIYSFLNYGSIAWTTTHFTKLKSISFKQKQAARIVCTGSNFMHRLKIDDLPKNFNNTLINQVTNIQQNFQLEKAFYKEQ